ncbi:hypothetical protein [Luteolibacter sp. Populi]|uniref:hypothetical protein n=1 Tax=Luteolibacter sp. Populi TaxID=3230487 RepID=UPI003466147D
MLPFRTIIPCLLICSAFATQAAPLRFPSPKGDLVLLVDRNPDKADTIRLEGPSGKLFLTLAVEDDLKTGQIKEGSVLWSPAGDAAAFAVGNDQKFEAWAFVRATEGWKYLKLPKPADAEKGTLTSYQSIPSKWQGDRLTLNITAASPTAKPDAPALSGSLVVAIDVEGGSAKKVEETIATPAPVKEAQ